MTRRARGFTLIEMLVAALIFAVLAAMATELFGGSRYETVDAAVSLLEADLGYARSAAIATPADPVMLRISADGTGYYLARASAPSTVLTGPNGPLRVTFGTGRASAAAGATLTSSGSRDVSFGPFGGVMDPVPTLTVGLAGGPEKARVVLDPYTGDATTTYQSQ